MDFHSNITAGEKPLPASAFTFSSILDETCERLLDQQVKYAIQRKNEMEKRLCAMERELDEFLRRR